MSAKRKPVFFVQALTAATAVSVTDSTEDEANCASRSDILTVLPVISVI